METHTWGTFPKLIAEKHQKQDLVNKILFVSIWHAKLRTWAAYWPFPVCSSRCPQNILTRPAQPVSYSCTRHSRMLSSYRTCTTCSWPCSAFRQIMACHEKFNFGKLWKGTNSGILASPHSPGQHFPDCLWYCWDFENKTQPVCCHQPLPQANVLLFQVLSQQQLAKSFGTLWVAWEGMYVCPLTSPCSFSFFRVTFSGPSTMKGGGGEGSTSMINITVFWTKFLPTKVERASQRGDTMGSSASKHDSADKLQSGPNTTQVSGRGLAVGSTS